MSFSMVNSRGGLYTTTTRLCQHQLNSCVKVKKGILWSKAYSKALHTIKPYFSLTSPPANVIIYSLLIIYKLIEWKREYKHKIVHALICTKLTWVKYRLIKKPLLQMEFFKLKNTHKLYVTIFIIHEFFQNELTKSLICAWILLELNRLCS